MWLLVEQRFVRLALLVCRNGQPGEWIQSDLGGLCTVRVIQINYADQDAEFFGKRTDIFHQYRLLHSRDGKKWKVLVDKSQNKTDVPHDYVELPKAVKTAVYQIGQHPCNDG
ncbi:MAG: discoidin domain-containing protein [Saprospiraceae bacterium]|nr:discoidin domain-containing protein [Saprospiraceae bacterium]MDZ4704528.1 discoidin domain-containing protein [Saprospiraceae bacterium]